MAYYGVAKPAVFMFLLVTVGVSASAIAAGVAERESRVYNVSAVQDSIVDIAKHTDAALDEQESRVCALIDGVTADMENVGRVTQANRILADRLVANGADGNCSQPRR